METVLIALDMERQGQAEHGDLVAQIRAIEQRVDEMERRQKEFQWFNKYFRELWNSYGTLRFLLHPNAYTDTYTTSGTAQSVDDGTPTQVYYFCYNANANEMFLRPTILGGFGWIETAIGTS